MHLARLLLAQRHWAALICAAALLLKLLVPTGYMIDNGPAGLTIMICSGVESRTMDMAGMHGGMPDQGKSKEHGKVDMPCAFSGLSAAALGAIDPMLVAALIAFVMAMGLFSFALPPPSRPVRLRPPLRGPPTSY